MDFALPATGDASKGIVDLTRGSRIRLSFAEDTRDRDPLDPADPAGAASLHEGDLARALELDSRLGIGRSSFEALDVTTRTVPPSPPLLESTLWPHHKQQLPGRNPGLSTLRFYLSRRLHQLSLWYRAPHQFPRHGFCFARQGLSS
uniref:Uncharacterized protein n=1 Tax=Sphaerodactylus townsendi TaxID=933632 RepID=A0ACB8EN28_9SAUR